MLGQRRRQWTNINSTLCQRLVFTGIRATFNVEIQHQHASNINRREFWHTIEAVHYWINYNLIDVFDGDSGEPQGVTIGWYGVVNVLTATFVGMLVPTESLFDVDIYTHSSVTGLDCRQAVHRLPPRQTKQPRSHTIIYYYRGVIYPGKHDTSIQCWINVGPASETLAQHWFNIVHTCRICWDSIKASICIVGLRTRYHHYMEILEYFQKLINDGGHTLFQRHKLIVHH